MSNLINDVKTGLKGVRGAGDAVRGELMQATDQAFDKNPSHPTTQASQSKNQAIAEKGKQDVRKVDDMAARREWGKEGVSAPPANAQTGTTTEHHGITNNRAV
ncbi:hypothetical protein F4778DRAFT_729201 [Xylariomycetidae sp. FL2044]|nr:hypothetical protein F4778DRAFT_729201 [Xylariomycetidae sp. FL2044]